MIRKCKQCDIPESLVDRMLFSPSTVTLIILIGGLIMVSFVRTDQAVSTSVGFIPFAGDILIACALSPLRDRAQPTLNESSA